MAICPFAIQKPVPGSPADAGAYLGGPFRIVHHTTEGDTFQGAFDTYKTGHKTPHFTVDDEHIYQHLDTDVAARALKGAHRDAHDRVIQTNRLSAVQIEVVGHAASHPKKAATLANVARLCRWIETTHGVPKEWPAGRPIQNSSDPQPRSIDIWTAKGGHYGHCHVPFNDHTDPGYNDTEFDAVMADVANVVERESMVAFAESIPTTLRPVLVVHGVSNHDKAGVEARVRLLGERFEDRYGKGWDFIPVFWGDLGGREVGIDATVPVLESFVASGTDAMSDLLPATAALPTPLSLDAQATILAERLGPDVAKEETTFDDLRNALAQTEYLQRLGDEALLERVGEVITRSQTGPELEAFGLTNPFKDLFGSIDRLVGEAVQKALGTLNTKARNAIGPAFSGFAGDIFAYQRNQRKIQSRVWEALAARGYSEYGSKDHPVDVVAHSLGALVCFDAAIFGTTPGTLPTAGSLWMRSFTTFGSQPSFFHVLDPRQELPAYVPGVPVNLPPTIGQWINLWDPMDVLAFLQGKIFALSNGSHPRDLESQLSGSELVSNRGWTHSAYWESDLLLETLRENLE